jgi:peptidoglycan/xylan/chitin deacetylase (PgdA/CDA1 family)
MLHRSNPDFDAVAFLKDFVSILQEKQMHMVTYQELSAHPDLSAAEVGKLMIITIDDINLQAKIDPSVQQMIAILREAKYPAVLGIVTAGKLADEETSAMLKTLAGEGWELAMHTENHTDLHVLEQTSPYGARLEIRTCAEKIKKATGVQPITLVLPYGNMVADLKILYREHVVWVVGIVSGEKYRTTRQVYYVGRESPAGTAQRTFDVMMKRFAATER